MARKKKEKGGGGTPAWLITFSDLVTLLLTFFVLLLSMASMDRVMLSQMSPFQSRAEIISHQGSGKVPTRVTVLLKLLEDTQMALNKPERIKDLLFPDDVLPPDIDVSTLDRNLRILEHPEGLAIVLTDSLLFPSGSYTLNPAAEKLLEQVGMMLQYTTADCNIAGHTDNMPSAPLDNYALSGMRAMAVLDYFLALGIAPQRFSVSGYGPDKPAMDNMTEAGRAQNRRVEILIKTSQWMGRYM
ncbi:OmpA/MotB family protein [Desulfovibrio psychrotolerans]|uniref:Chemotaxis protein MotB n=1 Tax=Desulfovibrio psychrotolerans TaxID=415242 RepID=A0A7J0BRL3_9BACT|nr:OmpA family protein [Desulfovibrio psychrotolerans]GFM36357.1 chemotaxis protein MotB [Desulfovibrio psychrotolerans]